MKFKIAALLPFSPYINKIFLTAVVFLFSAFLPVSAFCVSYGDLQSAWTSDTDTEITLDQNITATGMLGMKYANSVLTLNANGFEIDGNSNILFYIPYSSDVNFNSLIVKNTSMVAAVTNAAGNVNFTGNTLFENNLTGAIDNGAVMNFQGPMLFSQNSSSNSGGALVNSGIFSFYDSVTFDENTSDSLGGALFAYKTLNYEPSVFYGTVNFTGNSARSGGGAAFFQQKDAVFKEIVAFSSNTVTGNSTLGGGGALSITRSSVTFENLAIFTGNTSMVNIGGAVSMFVNSGSNINTLNFQQGVKFIDNSAEASNGGAVAIGASGSGLNIKQTLNIGGTDSEFISNTAKNNGGAVYVNTNIFDINIQNALFSDNQALTGAGGAVYLTGAAPSDNKFLNVSNSIFENNQAATDGGAVNIQGKTSAILQDIIFENNTSGRYGGAINIAGETSTLNSVLTINTAANTLFQGNSAGGEGGGLYMGDYATVTFNTDSGAAVDFYDSIASLEGAVNNGLNLRGEGMFNLHGDGSKFYSNINLSSGTLNLGSGTMLNANNFIMQNAVLKMDTDASKLTAKTFGADSDSKIKMSIYTNGTNDSISVEDIAVIDGELSVKAQVGVYQEQSFTLINAGTLSGLLVNDILTGNPALASFDGTNMIGQYQLGFDATSNSIILNIISASISSNFEALAKTYNQKSFSYALDALSAYSSGDLNTVINGLLDIPQELRAEAISLMSPYFLANVIQSRTLTPDYKEIYPRIQAYDEDGNVLKSSLWAQIKGYEDILKENENSIGKFTSSNYGGVFGYDSFIDGSDVMLGVYGNYNKSDIKQADSVAETTSLGIGLYGGLIKEQWEVLGLISGGMDNYKTKRQTGYQNRTAEGSFDGYNLGIDFEGAYKIKVGKYDFRPFAGIENKLVQYGSFKESGAEALNQHVNSDRTLRSIIRAGVSIGKTYDKYGWYANIEGKYVLNGFDTLITSRLENTDIEFKTISAQSDRILYGAGIGGNYKVAANWQLYANASALLNTQYNGYYGNIGVRYSFGKIAKEDENGEYPFELLSPEMQEAMSGTAEYDRSELSDEMKQALSAAKPDLVQIRVKLSDSLFAKGRAALEPNLKNYLKEKAEEIKRFDYSKITITGHTDKTGTEAGNLQLSRQRAKTVADYLVTQGLDKGKIITAGEGSKKPIADNKTAEGREANRRVEIKVE